MIPVPNGFRALLLAGVLVVAGCKVFDNATPVELALVGPSATTGAFRFQVKAPGAGKAELLVDGRPLGAGFATGAPFTADLLGFVDGRHQVTARVRDGELERESAAVEVTIDRTPPRVASLSPPQVPRLAAMSHYQVKLTFDEPLDRASVAPGWVTCTSQRSTGGMQDCAADATLSADGMDVNVAVSTVPADAGIFYLTYHVRNLVGLANDAWNQSLGWALTPVTASIWAPVADAEVLGPVDIDVSWRPSKPPDTLEIRVDGVRVGDIGLGARLRWDSSTVPDGPHTLTVQLESQVLATRPFRTANGPPSLRSCTARSTTPPDIWVKDGVLVTFDRDVCGNGRDLPPCAGPWTGEGSITSMTGSWSRQWIWFPPGPGALHPSFAQLASRSGAVATTGMDCTVDVPFWRAPSGDPVAGLSTLSSAVPFDTDGWYFRAVGIAGGGTSLPGAVLVWEKTGTAEWATPGRALNSVPFVAATSLRGSGASAAWLEIDGAGSTSVRWAQYLGDPGTTVATFDASAAPNELAIGPEALAWTRPAGMGRQELLLAHRPLYDWLITGPANVSPTGSATQPSQPIVPRSATIAFVETEPGGPGQLMARAIDYAAPHGWLAPAGPLNQDPAVSAAEPSLATNVFGQTCLAWSENGKVWARLGTGDNSAWGGASLLNADAAAPARSPAVVMSGWFVYRVVFVERGADGDRFEVRSLDTSKWSGLDAPPWVSLPPLRTGGDVARFSVASPTAILWQDSAGANHFHVYNE